MDKEHLISKLNWFYSLEMNQIEMYKTQSREAGELAGHVAGKVTGLTDREKTLRFNIALWDNLIDKEFHKSWMLEYLHNVN